MRFLEILGKIILAVFLMLVVAVLLIALVILIFYLIWDGVQW